MLLAWIGVVGHRPVVPVVKALLFVPDEKCGSLTIRTHVSLRALRTGYISRPQCSKNLATLTEFVCVYLMAQLVTGKLVDWSSLPIRPVGPGPDKDTRSSQGSARTGGQEADGEQKKSARHSFAGDSSFDREVTVATGSVASFGGVSHSPATAVV